MAEYNGNIAVPGGNIGSGEAQVFNPMPTLQVLNQFQTRADNKAKLAALEKMKAEAAAKPKPIDYPEMEIKGSGGLFRKIFNERQTAENLRSIDRIRQSNGDPYATTIEATRRKGQMAGEAAFLDEQEAKVKAATEDLRKQGYVVDPDKILYPHLNEKNYLNPNLVNDYVGMVKSDPNTFNFAEVGKQAEGIAGKVKRAVTQPNGSTKKEDFPVFIRPLKNNPYVREISVKDAVPVLLQTPAGREQLPILVGTELQAMNVNPAIANKRLEDLSDIEKGALRAAQTKAVSKYFQGRGDVSVVEDFSVDKSSGREPKNPPVVREKGPVDINFTFVPNYGDATPKDDKGRKYSYADWTPKQKNALTQQGELHLGMGDTHYFEKPQKAGSNKRVILLSNNQDAIDEGLVEKNKLGGYNLKTSFNYNATTPITVRVFKTDTKFPFNGPTKYTIDALTPITDDTYEKMTPAEREKYVTNVKGHLISPSGGVPEETEDGVKYNQSKVAQTQVVVLDESAEDIRSAMTRGTKQKPSSQKSFKFKHN